MTQFIDTTLRDGQQSPLLFYNNTYRFSYQEKKLLLKGLITLGVKHFEMFSPVVGRAEQDEFKRLQEYCKNLNSDVLFLCHSRCHPKDIELALKAGFDGINLFFGVSKESRNNGHGKDLEYIKHTVVEQLQAIRSQHPDIYLRFSGEDAFRTSWEDLTTVFDVVVPYVNTLGIPDTVGTARPQQVKERIQAFKKRYPDTALECHFHNDRGFALINSLVAVENGVEYIDTAVWGLAERSGITSITGILFNLIREELDIPDGYDITQCYPLNVLMGSILGLHVPYNEPVSLTNRTHIAGVHTKSVLNSNSVYEHHNLHQFGVTSQQLLLGPLSGWNLMKYYLQEIEQFEITDTQAKTISAEFKERTDEICAGFSPEQLLVELALEHTLTKTKRPKIYTQMKEDLS